MAWVISGSIAVLLMVAISPAMADSKHYYPWLSAYENFPTPSHDPQALALLKNAAAKMALTDPDFAGASDALRQAMGIEIDGDRQPQPAAMYDGPADINNNVIGQIGVALQAVAAKDTLSAVGFIDNAIVGGDYKACYLTVPASCVRPNPKSEGAP